MSVQHVDFTIIFNHLEELKKEENQASYKKIENEEYDEIRTLGEIVREIEVPELTCFAST
ncbi:MAG: hypothetical protein EPO24_00955 [Bacteroidetes bacterium]|nr:MAG: hypothetical protein EPO24_00955 [Bacteroidota bacterium]